MKKTLVTLFACTGFASAATLTSIATMEDLVNAGTNNGVTTVDGYDQIVYSFTESTAITNITNTALSEAIAGDQWVTIAAWVKLDSNADTYNTIFGWGETGKGFKFTLKDQDAAFVTKNVQETTAGTNVITKGEWSLIAISFAGDASTSNSVRFINGTGGSNYYTRNYSDWNVPSTDKFAIGSQLADSVNEGFNGEIAGLTVFTSTEQATGAELAAVMSIPTIVPEPATASLSLLGLAALMIRRRR